MSIPEFFASMEKELGEIEEHIEQLCRFKDKLSRHPVAFDESDLAMIETYTNRGNALKQEMAKREHMYMKNIKKLEQVLAERMSVIEEFNSETGILEEHPDLMESFVEKHRQLAEMMDEMKQKVSAPVTTRLQ